jgi:hypothetical protein
MKYSCNDRVKLRGVMPFIPEEPVYIIDAVINNDKIIYTTPTNNIFVITYVTLMYEINPSGFCGIEVRDALTNAVYRIAYAQYGSAKSEEKNITPYFPFEVPGEHTLNIFADTNTGITVSISGFLRSINV